jgi:hypothetical protein
MHRNASTAAPFVVGRLESATGSGVASSWRITTDDADVASKAHVLFGAQKGALQPGTNGRYEVATAVDSVEILLDEPFAICQRAVAWRNGTPIEILSRKPTCRDGEDRRSDSHEHLTIAERKTKARLGFAAEPEIAIYFRLAKSPVLGVFEFTTVSWSFASDLACLSGREAPDAANLGTKAALSLESVSFISKNGPRAGSFVQYTKPVFVRI